MKIIRHLMICLVVITMLISSVLPVKAAPFTSLPQDGPVISPYQIDLNLMPGTGFTQEVDVTTGKIPIPKLDVLFLFDTTSSMGDVLDSARENGLEIMDKVRALVPDAAFGVASFADYPKSYDYRGYAANYGNTGDYPWNFDQPITTTAADAQNGIKSLTIHDGGDGPEDYSRALFESMLVNWRPGSKKAVILFGDAPAHDLNFFGINLGVDPGVDEIPGTADDLVFTDVVQKVAELPVIVYPVVSPQDELAQKGFQYIADQTGGHLFMMGNVSELPSLVVQGLSEASNVIKQLSLTAGPDKPDWVELKTPPYENVGGGETHSFEVSINVPSSTSTGEYNFKLTVSADGATLGEIPAVIRVGGKPLVAADLANQKREIIKYLSSPDVTVEVIGADVPFINLATYQEQEKTATAFLDSLNLVKISPSEVGSLSQLTIQEKATQTLWKTNIESLNITGKHISNVIMVGISAIDFLKFLNSSEIADKLSGIFSKVTSEIQKKMADFLADFLLAVVKMLPDSSAPEMQQLEIGVEQFRNTTDLILSEHPGKTMLEVLGGGLITYAFAEGVNKSYVDKTKIDIPLAVNAAREEASKEATIDAVSSTSAKIENDVNGVVNPVLSQMASVTDYSKGVEKAQGIEKVFADIAGLAATATTGTPFGAVMKVLSIVINVVDAASSVTVIYKSVRVYSTIAAANQAATQLAFPSTVPSTFDLNPRLGSLRPVIFHERPVDLSSFNIIKAVNLAPTLTFANTLSSRLEASDDELKSLLGQLNAAVSSGDVAEVKRLIDPLIAADTNYSSTLRSTEAPILEAASSDTLGNDNTWQEGYGGMVASTGKFTLSGASFYVGLMGYLYNPNDAEARGALQNAVQQELGAIDQANTSVTALLPAAEKVISFPIISIADLNQPETNIRQGQKMEITVELSNPVSLGAEDVNVAFQPQDGLQVQSPASVSIGHMNGNGTAESKFVVWLTAPVGNAVIETSSSNGKGQRRVFQASETIKSSAGSGGAGLFIVVAVLAVTGIGVYTLSLKRKRNLRGVKPARLFITAGERAGQVIPFLKDGFLIGRGSACDLKLTERSVSRQHAQIRFAQGAWYLQDLGSAAGTLVNGQRITAIRLNSNDRISIGSTVITFQEIK